MLAPGRTPQLCVQPLVLSLALNTHTGPQGPIYCCVTNDALDSVADRTPPGRAADLVLLQNGWLLPWLRARGLLGKVTQVALYMAGAPRLLFLLMVGHAVAIVMCRGPLASWKLAGGGGGLLAMQRVLAVRWNECWPEL